jgi:pyruvate-ferredoxin/flavodoxin oxidoreductase
MLPNMHKIAGELLPTVFHVSARSLACQALSIFGDHSDVMNCRTTGFGFLCANTVQEVMDFALISQAVTLESRLPFIHFFEGFRVSHELQKIEELTFDDMRHMIDDELVKAHQARGMSPDSPTIRGTSQNPDVYFQGRETVNKYYEACPDIVQKAMDKFAKLTGRQYRLFDYEGDPQAERVIVCMGSGCEPIAETVAQLNKNGAKLGLLKVHLYRPWPSEAFLAALPKTVKKIAVLDRTKEPGSQGEPLLQDVINCVYDAQDGKDAPFTESPLIIGGRYGLSSKEFTPAMVKAVYDELAKDSPKRRFTVGINDDVTNTSLEYDASFDIKEDIYQALFYGLGADGTVGANKNSIKIINGNSDDQAQGYFVYDSKKAGAVTVSHVRFGKNAIRKPYLISCANFVACHNFSFVEKYNMLRQLDTGGIFLLNSTFGPDEVWDHLPQEMQKQLIDRKAKFYVIDAYQIGEDLGLGPRINIIMQAAFFKISGIMPEKKAAEVIKNAIEKTYGSKGPQIVEMNNKACDAGIEKSKEVKYPSEVTSKITMPDIVPADAPAFVKEVTATIIQQEGESIKVSQMPADGVWPTATTQYEKRNIATTIPVWNHENCTQCGRCSLVCPHAVIRQKVYAPEALKGAPDSFKSTDALGGSAYKGLKYTLQVSPEDCTSCSNCANFCPVAKDPKPLNMLQQMPLRAQERENWEFFLSLPEADENIINRASVKGSQFVRPLFEFSGACAGCGETPYVKLMTQLFGDRAVIANATGCSSIYGGNLPTTPYCQRSDGRGPTWNNSLFEDTAEIAYGLRLSTDMGTINANSLAKDLIKSSKDSKLKKLLEQVLEADQSSQVAIEELRSLIDSLKKALKSEKDEKATRLLNYVDYFVNKSVWGVGGDGWAYDIGYGGLDHVMSLNSNVNLLVLDTEVYSNTGGQASKATPIGAIARFAEAGKPVGKKDLASMIMSYGTAYVAKIALGQNPNQTVKAFIEAEAYDGPSIIIAYSPCVAHGIDMTKSLEEQKTAVTSGHWPLLRYNPELLAAGQNPLQLDSQAPTISIADYAGGENRFRQLKRLNPERYEELIGQGQKFADQRWSYLSQLAKMDFGGEQKEAKKEE